MDSQKNNKMNRIKTFFTLVLATATMSGFAQQFITRNGVTHFQASVETFEPVEATNESTTAIINLETGEVAALLFVNAFDFKIALMQEHFNENYMNTAKYPRSTLNGAIRAFKPAELNEEYKVYMLEGELTIKGITREIITQIEVKKVNDRLFVQSKLKVDPADFEIEIPGLVKEKIADKVTIKIAYELKEKS